MSIKFSLQSVLDYRNNIVKTLEIDLRHLLLTKEKIINHINKLEERRLILVKKLFECQTHQINLVMSIRFRDNIKHIYNESQNLLEQIKDLDQKIKTKQMEIITAKQDEEALVKLKKNLLQKHKKKQVRKEQLLVDDIYISQAFRRSLKL